MVIQLTFNSNSVVIQLRSYDVWLLTPDWYTIKFSVTRSHSTIQSFIHSIIGFRFQSFNLQSTINNHGGWDWDESVFKIQYSLLASCRLVWYSIFTHIFQLIGNAKLEIWSWKLVIESWMAIDIKKHINCHSLMRHSLSLSSPRLRSAVRNSLFNIRHLSVNLHSCIPATLQPRTNPFLQTCILEVSMVIQLSFAHYIRVICLHVNRS